MVIFTYSSWLVQHISLLHHRLLLLCLGAGALETNKGDKDFLILSSVIKLHYRLIVELDFGAGQGFALVVGKVRMRTSSKISASLV